MRPPFGSRANASIVDSMSAASRIGAADTIRPSDEAAVSTSAKKPDQAGVDGSEMQATRVTWGAICLSNSSCFARKATSWEANPVMLPPGGGRLLVKPGPIGSETLENKIGSRQ